MRRSARIDSNHHEIQSALERDGWSVYSWAARGGPVDLLVTDKLVTWVAEVKDGSIRPSHRRLTRDEAKFLSRWPGPAAIVTSPEEALLAGYVSRGGELTSGIEACARYLADTGGVAR